MAWTVRYVSVAGAGAHDGTSEANAFTLAEAITDEATPRTGYQYNLILGTYANTTTGRTFSGVGTTTAPNWWRGYKTTIGDLDDWFTLPRSLQDAVNLPLITFTTGQMILSGAHKIMSNLDITSQCTTTKGAVAVTSGNVKLAGMRIENTAANSAARALTLDTNGPVIIVGGRFKATTTAGIAVSVNVLTHMTAPQVIGGVIGIQSAGALSCFKPVIHSFVTSGIQCGSATQGILLVNPTIYAAGTNGIDVSSLPTSGFVTIINPIIGGCTNGINASGGATNGVTLFNPHFYNCTNNLVNITEIATVGADLGILFKMVDEDTDPFVNKAAGDFSLASGAIDRNAGFPGIIEGQTAMVNYSDRGAVGHEDPAGLVPLTVQATDSLSRRTY